MTRELTRKLGLWAALAIAVGATVGAGIFTTFGEVGKAATSPNIAILAWIIGGIITLPKMMIFAELATAYPDDGARTFI